MRYRTDNAGSFMTSSVKKLQFIFDQVTKTGMVVNGERIATIPGKVTSQADAERLGREVAEKLGWIEHT